MLMRAFAEEKVTREVKLEATDQRLKNTTTGNVVCLTAGVLTLFCPDVACVVKCVRVCALSCRLLGSSLIVTLATAIGVLGSSFPTLGGV